jgi:metallo-beta-lactamase family protein
MEELKIKFLGAARTVTGSCYILETLGHRLAIDCGLHQGNQAIERRNWDVEKYDPQRIESFIISHAHIDHCGLLPVMVKNGFRGKIYATPPTRDLMEIMLMDSAHIQETEASWKNKKRLRWGEKRVAPLYTRDDARATLPLVVTRSYDQPFQPFPGLKANFRDAGHILGSSLVEIFVDEGRGPSHLVFSGDIGRPAQLLMEDASIVPRADFLFMESTYGDRDHKNEADSLDELAEAIHYSYRHGEKVIIPSFAVERAQEVIYSLYLLSKDGRLPAGMPIFLDSPLAIQATEIFRRHPEYLDAPTQKLLQKGEDPFSLPQLRFTLTPQESMAINTYSGPAIVISASGMAEAGRIKHHLKHNLWREGASIVFVGFQAQGTNGRKIVDGAKSIRLFQEEVSVRARIFTINGFSAHAGQSQLLDWLGHFQTEGLQIFLVHGEYKAQQALAEEIRKRRPNPIVIPDYLEEITLQAGEQPERVSFPAQAQSPIDWASLLGDLDSHLALLRQRQKALESKKWVEQTDLQERLLELKRGLAQIVSEIQ